MTTTTWMAQIPSRTDAERKADRDELLHDLETARDELERARCSVERATLAPTVTLPPSTTPEHGPGSQSGSAGGT